MLCLFGALSQFHALIRVRVSGGRSVSLSDGLEQVGTRWNHRNSMVDLQCQGQPAESPEDAASFVSNSSTEDVPESPTDSVSGVSVAIRCLCFSSFRLAQPRPTVRGMAAWQHGRPPHAQVDPFGRWLSTSCDNKICKIFTAADNDNSSPLSLS